LSDFEKGKIVRVRLAGTLATKIPILLGVSRATVSEVMSAYTNHGKATSAKSNSGRKPTMTERDRSTLRVASKNHRTTIVQVTAELGIHLEDPVSTKAVRRELHKSNSHDRAAIAKPLITETNAQIRKRWCHDHKTWTSDNWNHVRDMVG
jgi:transposase